uniref:Ribosomal eL28/Mak16 domain-containing protein n=1 Tax=Trieres chinensis TaxID=1514140 RepID=A0A7S2EU82_TRICV|mmetsp:Transcript_38021/g.77576  ORF Transcript_38021/g.77576 Transcript_38021/m.77576 type:complete len:151 (+) Transcript_38021:149-601(+)|eukprot:CAMPEP_0183296480 /NCGR_PEP_ID=MMETSP0160_2-20130417/4013_1 /TAXON_ID=2839 ORGANISM="Odontella Sinensis, Strain Grunow 1884" /NCGR_SAMPLE_ID=MMETSP0160_2 /ASSEMBLY_ACC=CAM_ASM_000250 /LENGTH=150 /DNA_ID=CAMNT_0025458095 /DNA_START=85 /DNA_END=537 /DNA_ORIENTATION=-
MVHCPDALVWQLVNRNNCFMKKTNGRTSRSGSIKFSVEPGNLRSLSTLRYSGIANTKAVGIDFAEGDKAVLTTKTASKASTAPKKGRATIPLNKDYRRTEKTIRSQVLDNRYRPDLVGAATAKYSAVYRANRFAKGVKKAPAVKKGRSKK